MTGLFAGISKDYVTNKFLLTVRVNEDIAAGYEELKDLECLDISIEKHRRRRSLDANAYFHVLVGKIADKLRISKPRCKNILIGRYGQIEYLDDGVPAVIKTNVDVDQMLEQETLHVVPCGVDRQGGKDINYFRIYRGSHTYDTREMSILIDGTMQEAKELGIETMTPSEIERMKSAWQARKSCGVL